MPKPRDEWNLPKPEDIKNTDQLLNVAAFDHLKQLVAFIPEILNQSDIIKNIYQYCGEEIEYDASYAYGNLYSQFINFIEELISTYKQLGKNKELESLDPLLFAIFCNPNQALEYTTAVIEPTVRKTHQTSNAIEKVITNKLSPKNECLNTNNPTFEGSYKGRGYASLAGILVYPEYKSLQNTNVPQVLNFKFKQDSKLATELRIGTQGQYHLGHARISPLFEHFLDAQKRLYPKKDITHVYFNNLRLDESCYEASWEKALSDQLHNLESMHSNVAVISIPADFKISELSTTDNFKSLLINSVMKNKRGFMISEAARDKLFSPREHEKIILNALFQNTLKQLGLLEPRRDFLSDIEQQAVFNHFSKYSLQDYILGQLDPHTFNNSCKDGIDRSRVSSLILNLIWSINVGKPISEKEFLRGLHGASTLVKGRGMNSNSQKLWAMVDVYLKGNPGLVKSGAIPQWLVDWRNSNEPDLEKIKTNLLSQLKSENESKDLLGLINLFDQVMDWNNLDNPYRELARQLGWSLSSYGYTDSIYDAAEFLKNSILEKSQQQISQMSTELKEKVCKVSETHAHPYPFCRFGETKQMSDPTYTQFRADIDEQNRQQREGNISLDRF
ncbi:MAG: hypothetical protein EP298_11280 [Gammaproteobacteria bacterium]|nr:MAG: hypothetical protein EP298_11280 [Gammaproteobacteria bacterium]UTW43201.1 hypothetical protein KFE69_03385 [bacterium SCSIO 12844]